MKKEQLKNFNRTLILLLALVSSSLVTHSQVSYISPFTGNQGGGTALFAQCVPDGNSNMFLDWEVFVSDNLCNGIGSAGAGQGSSCRVIVRGMNADADPNSVIASAAECIIDGIYNGENGNNDRYFVNLNACNPQLTDGRYSVEIQCDCQGGDYNNYNGFSTAATTWNYFPNDGDSPEAYYLGACGLADGLDNISEVNTNGVCCAPSQLDYFTIGDADVYRTMVVINGLFIDMGKFTPGNPALPPSLHDIPLLYPDAGACLPLETFPPIGYCPTDVLELDGAETNISKVVDCNGDGNRGGFGDEADVTGNRIYYSVFPSGTPSGTFCSLNIPFNDNCPDGFYPGTGGNVFPMGGNCQNQGCIVDQRWQTSSANINLLECNAANACLGVSGPGSYTLQLYTETDIVDCGGIASTIREPQNPNDYYTTSFVVFDEDQARANKCTDFLAVSCTSEMACDADDGCINVTVTQAMVDAGNIPFSISYSMDGGAPVTATGTLSGTNLELCGLAPGSYTDVKVIDSSGCEFFGDSAGCDINEYQVN